MKKFIHLIAMMVIPVLVFSQNKDLPNPVSDMQLLPAGSYVIAMDNTNQVNTAGDFNLNAYGLVVFLLNRNIKIKWVIAVGKVKDGIDFSATATKMKPATGGLVNYDFKAGPFVINAADTSGVGILIDSFYYNPTGGTPVVSLKGNDRPSVYKTAANVTVDVRYNLYGFRPKAAILTDGGNQQIHVGYMNACSIPDSSWRYSLGTDLLTHCFTFASEPHNDKTGTPAFTIAMQGIRAFVEFGGNFLAQCAAVENYENNATYGHLQTDAGITARNLHHGNDRFTNNDLSYAQYDGYYHSTQTGHLQSWDISRGWANNGYMTQNDPSAIDGVDNIGASVSKLKSPDVRGGMVFYLGNHDFPNLTQIEDINGIRMYMNAFLTPVTINSNCSIGAPVPITWYSFTAIKSDLNVILEWKTTSELNNKYFYPERSTDGMHFIIIARLVGSLSSAGIKTYTTTDIKPGTGAFYYRIRQEDIDGTMSYSTTKAVQIDGEAGQVVNVYPNPGSGIFTITFRNSYAGNSMIVFDKTGAQVYRQSELNQNTIRVDLSRLTPGIYTAVFLSGDGSANITKKIVIIR